MIRIGVGFDVHALVRDRRLVLGGVEIPHSHGLLGHSDADVATHALCDALLGALALGDIGAMFPDTDPAYKGADSLALLRQVAVRVQACGAGIVNADLSIAIQTPRLAPYIEAMRQNLAASMGIAVFQVSVKATTTENLGFVGRAEGVAAHAVALLKVAGDEDETKNG